MVKSKRVKDLSFLEIFKVFFSFRVFENKRIPNMLVLVFSLIFLVINSIVSVLINHIPNYSAQSDISRVGSVIFGFPIIVFVVFLIFYIILNAIETNRKDFLESYLVFLGILLPFFTIGNVVNYVGQLLTLNFAIATIIPIFYLLLVIYLSAMLAGNFKYYYGTTLYRIITTYIVEYVLFFTIFFPAYLSTYLASL